MLEHMKCRERCPEPHIVHGKTQEPCLITVHQIVDNGDIWTNIGKMIGQQENIHVSHDLIQPRLFEQ
ncbi:hypothetical protein D3C76_1617790 [compost metagenome]